MQNIPVNITNWNEVKEQFGDLPETRYKKPIEILKEVTEQANKAIPIAERLLVEYEINNPDSGMCIFDFTGKQNGVMLYEYTGTIK